MTAKIGKLSRKKLIIYLRSLRASMAYWSCMSRAASMWWTRRDVTAVEMARNERFRALIDFARSRSPYYARIYGGLPTFGLDPQQVPVMTKRTLMAHFDEWVTDPRVNLRAVLAFLEDKHTVGERYLDRYVVWKSSGTTGEPGIYVEDAEALATYDALIAVQAGLAGLRPGYGWSVLAHGGRAALVVATDDHFASIALWQRAARENPWAQARGFSVMRPLPELVAMLNDFQPAFLASYPTTLSLLAEERAAGRLRIDPAALWSGGETLAPGTRFTIERAFECPVANEYGASECMSIAFGCREEWLHVNADWVLLEPVDCDYKPVPPGEASHTVLLTNLANRVQPIIRYDLGDSVVAKPEPCACGNPLPAMRVEGRCDDIVALRGPRGEMVRLPPIALTTVVEEAASVHRFQIVQRAPDRLSLRLVLGCPEERKAAWHVASTALKGYLVQNALPNVHVALDEDEPIIDTISGKLRQVVVAPASLRSTSAGAASESSPER